MCWWYNKHGFFCLKLLVHSNLWMYEYSCHSVEQMEDLKTDHFACLQPRWPTWWQADWGKERTRFICTGSLPKQDFLQKQSRLRYRLRLFPGPILKHVVSLNRLHKPSLFNSCGKIPHISVCVCVFYGLICLRGFNVSKAAAEGSSHTHTHLCVICSVNSTVSIWLLITELDWLHILDAIWTTEPSESRAESWFLITDETCVSVCLKCVC